MTGDNFRINVLLVLLSPILVPMYLWDRIKTRHERGARRK